MKKLLLSIFILFILIACRRAANERVQFPPETQNGANTFGCYIDGQPFIPFTTLFGNVRPINVHYTPIATPYYKAGFLSIQGIDARYSLGHAGSVLLQKLAVFATGDYSLQHIAACGNPYDCDSGGYYNAKEGRYYFIESGTLTITKLDTVNKIISGRFSFMAKDSSGNKKDVQGGVFDTQYRN
ncbi:hypothetical protein HRH25_07070 [Flavisolibacter sp. BT320]|nr:hypothetical protein [Flavisolibacter longurius]